GRLGDQFDRRKVFSLGLALFTLASLVCGVAGSAEMLVAARLLQGAAAAILMPNVLSIIGVAYTGSDRARALTAYGLVMGLAALALAPRVVPESRNEHASRLDVTGTLLVTAGLTAVVLPLVEGRQHGWP